MFNEKQTQVIDELNKNILLLASAGTGKTDTLSNRVAKIIKSDLAKDDEILCITFTNKACREMKERIKTIIGEDTNVVIKTFHGLCFDIIKYEAKRNTDVPCNFLIYDEEDCLDIVKKINKTQLKNDEVKAIIDFLRELRLEYELISNCEKRDINNTIKKLKSDREKLTEFCSRFKRKNVIAADVVIFLGAELVSMYEMELKKHGALDFTDLISITSRLFKQDKIVNEIASKYRFINIDEIQDTSIIEYNLIEKIFKKSNVLLCGDLFQTIYEWRGSNPNLIIEKFKFKYNPTEIVFDKNYRATKCLTECATEYLQNAFPDEMDKLFKNGLSSNSRETGEKIQLHGSYNVTQEARWIFNKILALPESERSKACILTRNNSYNIKLSKELRALAKGRVKFALIDDSKFFRKKEIKDIIAFMKLYINRYDAYAFKRIARLTDEGIDEEKIQQIESDDFKKSGINIIDFIDNRAIKDKDKYALLIKELNKNNVIVFDVESTGTDTTKDEIIQIAAIRINNKGEEIERFVKFLKPEKSVGSSAEVHGFSDQFLTENGLDKKKTLREFSKFIKGKLLVGHNVQYDINILESELQRNNLPKSKHKHFFDTLDIYRRFFPSAENHKLSTISMLISTKHTPNHNALYDILATGEILVHAVDNYIKPTSFTRKKLMTENIQNFKHLSDKLNSFFKDAQNLEPMDIITYVVKNFGLLDIYGSSSVESDNMRDFYFTAKHNNNPKLSKRDNTINFITNSTLSDGEIEKQMLLAGKIPIITVHQAKGLEFNYTFLAGMQDNVFPNDKSIKNNELDEEKKVFYVAITRAKKNVFISYSKFGRGQSNNKSRLLEYIDKKYINVV